MNESRGRLAVDIGPVTTVAAVARGAHRFAVVFGDRVAVATPTLDDGRDLVTALSSTGGQAAEPIIAALADHLRAVAAQAGAVETTLLTAPPSWGPRHQEMLNQAARIAGLPCARVISEAAAVATHMFPDAPQEAVVLVCQLGERASQATVLQRVGDDWTRVATQPIATATGDRLERALAELALGQAPATDRAAATFRQARLQLAAGDPVVAVAPDGSAPIELDARAWQEAAQPLRHAVRLAVADVLDAADVEADRLHACVVYGECAQTLTPQEAGWADLKAVTADDGRLAAVYGALEGVVAASAAAGSPLRSPLGLARHVGNLVAPVVCAAAAALLQWQIFEIVARLMPPSASRLAADYQKLSVYFDTAAFATAGCVLTLACLAAGRHFAAALLADPSGAQARRAGQVYAFSAVFGLALAVVQGLLGQSLVGGPAELAPPYLSSALAAALAPAIVAIVVGLAAPWLGGGPPWTDRVHFPISSAVLAVAGIAGLNARSYGLPVPAMPSVVMALLGVCGAGLLGVAIALAVVTQRAARFVLGALMAAACMIVVGFANLHNAIVVYLIIVALWWMRRAARIAADNLPHRWWTALRQAMGDSASGHDRR